MRPLCYFAEKTFRRGIVIRRNRWIVFCAVLLVPLCAMAADGVQQVANLGDCKLESGQVIHDCQLGYRTYGKLDAAADNAVMIPTWFGGTTASLASVVGPGNIFDSTKYFVITVDALANGISSSPSNSTVQPRMQFPIITIRDMVSTEYRLATEVLKLKHLHAVAGISMGGMQTFQWAASYPNFFDLAIPIVGTPRQTSYDLILWRAELQAIERDPNWKNGNYQGDPEMPVVADIHWLNGSTPEYQVEHTAASPYPQFAEKIEAAAHFDPNDRIRQLQAMIAQDIAPGETLQQAAKKLKAKFLIIPSAQDHMVNPTPALEIAKYLNAQTFVLHSDCGHGAFACEHDKLVPVVQTFLATGK